MEPLRSRLLEDRRFKSNEDRQMLTVLSLHGLFSWPKFVAVRTLNADCRNSPSSRLNTSKTLCLNAPVRIII